METLQVILNLICHVALLSVAFFAGSLWGMWLVVRRAGPGARHGWALPRPRDCPCCKARQRWACPPPETPWPNEP